MAVVISLTGKSFDQAQWREQVASFPFDISSLTMQLLEGAGGNPILDPSAPLHEEELWVHPLGGIRGVTIRNTSEGFDLSLPMGAGRVDWQCAGVLADAGRGLGAEVRIDGELTAEADWDAIFESQWGFDYAAMGSSIARSGGEGFVLPVGGILHLAVTDLKNSPADLHEALVDQMSRYSAAYIPSEMVVKGPDGRQLSACLVGGVPNLVSFATEAVIVLDHPEVSGNQAPLFNGAPVPMSDFFEIMGHRVESLGEVGYIPPYTISLEPELLARLEQAAGSSGSTPTAQAAQEGSSIEEKMNELAKGPILVFLLVAAADGEIEGKEFKAFTKTLMESLEMPGYLFQEMAKSALLNLHALTEEVATGMAVPLQFVVFMGILNTFPEAEVKLVKKNLYELGERIAGASGGFFGFGKISKEERKVLDALKKLLRLDF